MGVFPATLCPFHEDESIDEAGLRAYIRELVAVPGLKGLVPNGHTGEIMSLREAERAKVTRIVAEEVRKSVACRVSERTCPPEVPAHDTRHTTRDTRHATRDTRHAATEGHLRRLRRGESLCH
jgi:dihydrodipicolinate synthase/N-acetylneuraminate lyase